MPMHIKKIRVKEAVSQLICPVVYQGPKNHWEIEVVVKPGACFD